MDWGDCFVVCQYFMEIFNIGCGQCMDRIGRDGIDVNVFWIYGVSYIVDVSFQRGFGQIYYVIVWDCVFCVQVGECQQS